MRRWSGALVAVLVLAMLGLIAPAASAARAPYCGIRWGSLAKSVESAAPAPAVLVNVRAGRHSCYDRLVLDVRGDIASGRVRYVSELRADPSDQPIPLRGGARLQVVASAPDHDVDGNPTYSPANDQELVDVRGWRTFRQVALAGSFEGLTTIGLGVRARLPFRVFILDGPGDGSRLVIDVAHRW